MFLDIACVFIGENKDFVASVLDSSHCSANAIIEVLADKCLITLSTNCLQMHELIQSMAREIIRAEFRHDHRRLWISSEDYDELNVNNVTEDVEVLVLLLKKNCQNIPIDGQALTVNFSGTLDLLSNKLRLLYWHGMPFKFLPAGFYPENLVAIDFSYSHIQHLWTTPKCLRRLKVMKLRYCFNLTTTPDFSEITNLEELSFEGCVNLVSVHPSIEMLKKLLVLNLSDCNRLQNFPCRVEMEALQPRRWTSITGPFGLLNKQQHPHRSVSLAGLHMLKSLKLSYCNLVQVPDAIRGLSCLKYLFLKGNNLIEVPESIGGLSFLSFLNLDENNFTRLPGSVSQLSNLRDLSVDGCKKLEVLPELPLNLYSVSASDCTSLCSITGSMINTTSILFNCPKLFTDLAIDSQLSISETQCLDSSITSQGSASRFSSFLRYAGIQNNICELFRLPGSSIENMNIIYQGNSIPEWFTNKSMGNQVKVELPSDWCFNKIRGYGSCVVFRRKKLRELIGYSIKNFNGACLEDCFPYFLEEYFKGKPIRINEPYMIWLHYQRGWMRARNFVKFCFEENNEDVEVKECGARLIFDEDREQDVTNLSMLQDLPTLSQHGGASCMSRLGLDDYRTVNWSW
nr:hypothetical protein [Tanacetum cinerariifolium]